MKWDGLDRTVKPQGSLDSREAIIYINTKERGDYHAVVIRDHYYERHHPIVVVKVPSFFRVDSRLQFWYGGRFGLGSGIGRWFDNGRERGVDPWGDHDRFQRRCSYYSDFFSNLLWVLVWDKVLIRVSEY